MGRGDECESCSSLESSVFIPQVWRVHWSNEADNRSFTSAANSDEYLSNHNFIAWFKLALSKIGLRPRVPLARYSIRIQSSLRTRKPWWKVTLPEFILAVLWSEFLFFQECRRAMLVPSMYKRQLELIRKSQSSTITPESCYKYLIQSLLTNDDRDIANGKTSHAWSNLVRKLDS